MTLRFRHAALLLTVAMTLPASMTALAAETDIAVSDAYVRMAPPGTPTTGAFMTIKNLGSADRKLLKADSPAAKTVELHNHINDNGVMKMRPVKEIDIKSQGQAELKPGSYHVMLIDLKQTLNENETIPLTLTFDDGSTKKIDAPVRKPQAVMQKDMIKNPDHDKMKH
jgi:copper(I)-binding protein